MSAHNNLSKIQFKHTYNNGVWLGTHTIEAGKNGNYGHLTWDANTGNIEEIFVPEKHQRKGIATAMWNHAQQLSSETGITPPVHAPARTPEGDSWAKSVGGPGLNKKACTICGDDGHLATEHLYK
jgi:GNAT superfamily N-acetyltransferase